MDSPAYLGLAMDGLDLERLVSGQHHDPHSLLGVHPVRDDDGRDWVVIRGWRPDAIGMVILAREQRIEMSRVHGAGVFAGVLEGPDIPDYLLEATYPGGAVATADDPYRYWPTLGQLDLHLLAEGRDEGLWRHLGAQVRDIKDGPARRSRCGRPAPSGYGSSGTSTAGTAASPDAMLGSSGVWEIFLPDVGRGRALQVRGE